VTESIALIPLLCPQCRTALPANPDEVAWRCASCGSGWQLDEAQAEHGLGPLTISFDARLNPNTAGRPFWVAEGRVVVQRETYSGNSSRDAQQFWSVPRRFFVPAYACLLEALIHLGTEMLYEPPSLQPGDPAPFAAVTLPRADVSDMAEFIVAGVEAGRTDKLRRVDIQIQLATPELWVLP
jgi:hypothetical protein